MLFCQANFTAISDCGGKARTTATFRVYDKSPPPITEAQDVTMSSKENYKAEYSKWFNSYGGATCSADCRATSWLMLPAANPDGTPPPLVRFKNKASEPRIR